MINIIYGAKGTGKTKRIIDSANNAISDGDVVFITDSNEYNYTIKHKVRLINAKEFNIATEEALIGFIAGVIASNNDIQHVYIDGAHRLCAKDVCDMAYFYEHLEDLDKEGLAITLTASCDENALPDFVKKYI